MSGRSVILRGVWGSLLVLVGGLVISPIPDTLWPRHLPVIGELGQSLAGRMSGLAVTVVGLALLARAWLLLGRLRSVRLSITAAFCWAAPLLVAPPLFSRDGWSYVAQGAITNLGLDPYLVPPSMIRGALTAGVDPQWMDTPAPYGPLPLAVSSMLMRVSHDPYELIALQRLVALVGLALLAYALPRLARTCGADPTLATWLVVPGPVVVAHGVGGLHNDLLMVGLMAAGAAVTRERSWVLGAVLVGCAAAVKWPALLACLAVGALLAGCDGDPEERPAALVSLWAYARVAGVAVTTLLGWGVATSLGSGWLQAASVPGMVENPLSPPTALGLGVQTVLHGVDLSPVAGLAVPAARAAAALFALAVVVRLAWRCSPAACVRATGLAFVTVVALGPTMHFWYVLWCLPFLAAARPCVREVTALVGVSIVIGVAAPLDSSLRYSTTSIVIAVVLVATAVAALLGRLGRWSHWTSVPLPVATRAQAPAGPEPLRDVPPELAPVSADLSPASRR